MLLVPIFLWEKETLATDAMIRTKPPPRHQQHCWPDQRWIKGLIPINGVNSQSAFTAPWNHQPSLKAMPRWENNPRAFLASHLIHDPCPLFPNRWLPHHSIQRQGRFISCPQERVFFLGCGDNQEKMKFSLLVVLALVLFAAQGEVCS